ncbi:putative 4-coumarate--CoA ligase 2 [Cyphellophora attinorum]|uniref:Putative 4-coumarate--CoA ligase 2 n=1 Tax=Cyphellophora attinorum TaxID=1664694 RepID=A0A0N0NIX1_9EURO|nr:putative 4-coumarate--CoA ligase 2 [Phialophora attinorum]KPI36238.1 putative 4-coumarate--CoA ligase 2 [Phialophora attinorum]
MRIYHSEKDITIPQDLNLTQLLNNSKYEPSTIIAQDDFNRTLTIQQLKSTAGRLAAGLTDAFHPRDQSRWAVILPNSVAYLECCHAVLWLGGVFCPINHLLTPHELGNALAICQPEYITVSSDTLPRLQEGITLALTQQSSYAAPQIIIGLGDSTTHPKIESFLANDPLAVPVYPNTRQRLASIHLSSGTTGSSKGVALSHYNYVANVLQMLAHDPARFSPSARSHAAQRERVVSFTPYVHIANTTIPLFLGPLVGMCHFIMAKFELEALCRIVEREKATAMQCTPAIAVAIADTNLCERYDLSSVQRMVVGGLPLPKEIYDRFMSKGQWKTVQLYGMTEAAPYVTWQTVSETLPIRGQLGKILPGMSARLVDADTGKDAAEGEAGELWIKGPNVVAGYVDNPTATAAAFREGGWYNTGDVCTFSPEGYLTVVGRTKELIKSSGFQVAPTELEGYLNGHPLIADVAVGASVDKQRMTEVPTAFVVLKASITDKAAKVRALKEIQRSLDGKVSGYKKLKGGVWEVKSLPRTSTGKFTRKRLGEAKTGLSSFDAVDAEKAKL